MCLSHILIFNFHLKKKNNICKKFLSITDFMHNFLWLFNEPHVFSSYCLKIYRKQKSILNNLYFLCFFRISLFFMNRIINLSRILPLSRNDKNVQTRELNATVIFSIAATWHGKRVINTSLLMTMHPRLWQIIY